ncbi:hypothetical protein FHS94_001716 [Sphingomonas aerophila]|uniref:Uncharacterized protein n=1 Tax=Sphingomonas aerophila TaxID=1344948 RepID=A0A7W9BCU1_9SPHN|nr:hypothetical protein [Sphingomonas aerophila]
MVEQPWRGTTFRIDDIGNRLDDSSFWLMMMCAGNVWKYVPIRAITTHADIAIAASGLGLSVWVSRSCLSRRCFSLANFS